MKATRDTELIPVQSLNLLLKSIGATLTDVQDVVFKYAHMPSHTPAVCEVTGGRGHTVV